LILNNIVTINTEENIAISFGIILLAAGASRRLGKPKQLLLYNGQSLLQHNMNIASGSLAKQVIVVLGANAEAILSEIDQEMVHVAINTGWEEGMASSIRCGLNELLKADPFSEGAIVMVCDQPFVSASLLNNLVTTYQETGKPIIASSYENTFGPPALFHKSMFTELLQLKGDTGARKIIQQHANEVGIVPFPQGDIDIDKQSDYDNITNQRSL
jgi:molybdenum cofactor cytidylyltransferase